MQISLKTLWLFYIAPLFKPKKVFRYFGMRDDSVHYALLTLVIVGIFYSIITFITQMIALDFHLHFSFSSFTIIFYLIGLFFYYILTAIVLTGIIRIFAYLFQGKGSFIKLFPVISSAIVLPNTLSMVAFFIWYLRSLSGPAFGDFGLGYASSPYFNFSTVINFITAIWSFIIIGIGIGQIEKTDKKKTILITILTAIVSSFIMTSSNRLITNFLEMTVEILSNGY